MHACPPHTYTQLRSGCRLSPFLLQLRQGPTGTIKQACGIWWRCLPRFSPAKPLSINNPAPRRTPPQVSAYDNMAAPADLTINGPVVTSATPGVAVGKQLFCTGAAYTVRGAMPVGPHLTRSLAA